VPATILDYPARVKENTGRLPSADPPSKTCHLLLHSLSVCFPACSFLLWPATCYCLYLCCCTLPFLLLAYTLLLYRLFLYHVPSLFFTTCADHLGFWRCVKTTVGVMNMGFCCAAATHGARRFIITRVRTATCLRLARRQTDMTSGRNSRCEQPLVLQRRLTGERSASGGSCRQYRAAASCLALSR